MSALGGKAAVTRTFGDVAVWGTTDMDGQMPRSQLLAAGYPPLPSNFVIFCVIGVLRRHGGRPPSLIKCVDAKYAITKHMFGHFIPVTEIQVTSRSRG